MPADVNIASAIKEQLEDQFGLRGLNGLEVTSYQERLDHRRAGFRHVRIYSYVFYDDVRRVRVDVLEGKVYRPGCGGSHRDLMAIAKKVTL